MIFYNPAFDIYHTIFRILQLLNRFDDGMIIETERIRIWDFYLLFPSKIHEIKLKKEEEDIRKLRRTYVKKTDNPYQEIHESAKIFEKLKQYQLAALNCIASYGIISKELLNQQRVSLTNKELLSEIVKKYDDLSATEKNVISLMTSHFNQVSLYGTNGLKGRTGLMESRYDA
jgi:hypothetical protein